MDIEKCMSQNHYWTRLGMEWEPHLIDLDDEMPIDFVERKLATERSFADYYDNFPGMSRSIPNLRDSPYGINEFSKRMSSDNVGFGRFQDKRRKIFVEVNDGPHSLPIIYSSKSESSTELNSPSNSFSSSDSRLRSVEDICNYIDSVFDSIDRFIVDYKSEILQNGGYNIDDFIENSNSISGLSFDETSVSNREETETHNECKKLRKDDSEEFKFYENICNISLETSSAERKQYFEDNCSICYSKFCAEKLNVSNSTSMLGCTSSSESSDTRPTDFLEIIPDDSERKTDFHRLRNYWMRIVESIPPPPIPEGGIETIDFSFAEFENTNDIGCTKINNTTFIISSEDQNDGNGNSDLMHMAENCNCGSDICSEDPGFSEQDLDEAMDDYESFARGASMVETSDTRLSMKRFSAPLEDTNLESRDTFEERPVSHYFGNSTITSVFNDQYYSLPIDLNTENDESHLTKQIVCKPPENDLQKNSADRVLSEHQLRVQRSLQKLNLPDWYKNSPAPQQGFLLKKRASDATPGQGWPQTGLSGKTTSLGSLGQPSPPQNTGPARSPLTLTPQPYAFTRWSTSRLNSNQTSPCSSARSSIRGSGSGPPTPPSPSQRLPRPSRQPYLGWRSQERLSTPRTPHERLAVSLLPQSPPVPANVSEEIQTSIKEVTSAIVHYVSGLEPAAQDTSRAASPRGGRLCWVESSFVGTKPLESPQTPVVVSQPSPISQGQTRPLQLDLQPNGHTPTVASTTYQHDWQSPQRSLLNLGVSRPSPGSTTLEDVLDSLLGLPSAAPRAPSPQTSPRSPYMLLGLQSRYTDRSGSQCSSLQFSISSRTEDYHTASRISGEDVAEPWDVPQHLPYQPHHQQQQRLYDEEVSSAGRRRSSAGSSTTSTLAPGTDGADKDDNSSILSLPKLRGRAKSVASKRNASRRQSEPVTAQKSVSLDRRVSYDSHLLKTDLSLSRTSVSELQQSKTSLKSIASINTDASGEDMLVHCRYTKCTSATSHGEAKRHYKSCHNCNYMYCSRECRRAHWEKHRKVCLHSRASTLCKQILSTAKEDTDSLHHVSAIAHKGYLAHGRGVVKAFFTSPEAAEKFTVNGFQNLGEPTYVKWPDLLPNEMGPELYAELVKLCKSYNPETRLVLYVAVCIISEVPTKGAVVKWERQLVSRCAKIRLSKTVMGSIPHGQLPFHSSPKARVRSRDKQHRDKDKMLKIGNIETLILTSNSANLHNKGNYSAQKIREVSFNNIQMQLQKRGVNLKKHFPEVYSKLCAYVEGTCDKFTPMTVYPRDNLTGKSFMCVIMPETEPDKFYTLPRDSLECRTVDVSISDDAGSEQVSTPM